MLLRLLHSLAVVSDVGKYRILTFYNTVGGIFERFIHLLCGEKVFLILSQTILIQICFSPYFKQVSNLFFNNVLIFIQKMDLIHVLTLLY